MKTRMKTFIIALLLLSLTLSACAADEGYVDYDTSYQLESAGMSEEMPAPMLEKEMADGEMLIEPEAPMEEFTEEDMNFGDDELRSTNGSEMAVERMIIMNADVSMVVDDPAGKADEITRMATNMGGWVVHSNVYALETETKKIFNAQITIRVPVERLNEALDLIKADAIEIKYDNKNGQDVTEAYTDLASRKRNLEDTADKLREILASADDTEEALQVLETLTEITEQIEVIEGQMQYFSEASAMSSITVNLEAPLELYTPTPTMTPTATQVPTAASWNPGATASSSLTTLGNFLRGLADFLIGFVLLWLPILLLLALPFVLFFWFIRFLYKRNRRKKFGPAPTVKEKPEADSSIDTEE